MSAKTYASRTIERKDDSGAGDNAAITAEIKSFGDNVKKLREDITKDLADVRKIAEEAKEASPDLDAKLAEITDGIAQKQDAFEKLLDEQKARADKLETAMNRPGTSLGEKDEADVKAAIEFFETKAAAEGNRNWRNPTSAEDVDVKGYGEWAASFGMYLRAKDERMIDAKALSVGSNPDGGYLVPTAQSSRIIEKVYESSPLRQFATVESIGSEAIEIPVDADETGYGWVGEEETRATTDTPTVGIQRIPVHEMYAKPKATQKFLEDASINVEAWLASKVGERFARVEASAFITGTGVKMPRGILTYAAGTAGARGTIAQYNTGSAAALTADSIVGLPLKIKTAYTANARWLMKRSTVAAVMLLKDSNGQYLWRPALTAGTPSVLGGYTVHMADDMPAVAAGSLSIAFGDFRGYTVVDRLGISTLRDPFSAKPFVEFYSRKRVGGDVTDFEAFCILKTAA